MIHEYSIFLPLVFTLFWALTEGRKNPPSADVFYWWFGCLLVEIASSTLHVDEDLVELKGPIPFFCYLGVAFFFDKKISILSAFSLIWLSVLCTDIFYVLSEELGFAGIGGAGMGDALFFFPILAALLNYYVYWRKQ